MDMQATDLSAKLLATENLTVVRSAVQTASFDIKSRVLTLPMWKDMTPQIEDMLVGHEVGHALYTGEKYLEPIEKNPKMQSYLNVIEDVRIEKLIKRKYPGLRKRMNEGYKQLNERDFFGISKLDLNDMLLIDRINVYFKAGFQCGVKFNADEKVFVNRAERCETMEEVMQLAEDVWQYSKEQLEKAKEEQKQALGNESKDKWEEDDDEFGDNQSGDPSDIEEYQENKPQGKGAFQGEEENEQDIEDELQSKTERNFQEKLDELADQSTVYQYHSIEKSPIDPMIGYKQVLKDLDFKFDDMYITGWNQRWAYGNRTKEQYEEELMPGIQKFKADSNSSVNYLVKEFEMRKSATAYKRSMISKTGSLDMRKVYAYKLQDDLFKRVTTLPKGKNHGMVFLLDWSGSMTDVIMDTLKQVINLCMFCNKAQIPYEVLAFTTQYPETPEQYSVRRDYIRSLRDRTVQGDISIMEAGAQDFRLLQLFSHKMSMSEFNTMVKKLLDIRVFWHKGYDLGGTPLNDALVWVYQNLGEFIKNNRIEKMNLITLTDGQGSALQSTQGLHSSHYSDRKHYQRKNLVRDPVTKKTYEFTNEATQQTETLLKMIKDRYNVRTVGFFVCPNRRGSLIGAIRDNVHKFLGNADATVLAMRKSFKEDGFYSMQGTGRDDLFIIPQDSTKISEEELTVNSDMNSRALSKNLGKFLNTKKTSRVLLSRFINYVA